MLNSFISKISNRRAPKPHGFRGISLTHAGQLEDHYRRQREELCKQFRHQQYFYGYKPCS